MTDDDDPDVLTGCADDQIWANVPVEALRQEVERDSRVARLAGHIPEPHRERAVLDVIEKAGRPLIISEIADALGRPKATLTTPLSRLVDKDLVTREKVPIEYPHGRYPGRTQTIQTWLYRPAQPKSE